LSGWWSENACWVYRCLAAKFDTNSLTLRNRIPDVLHVNDACTGLCPVEERTLPFSLSKTLPSRFCKTPTVFSRAMYSSESKECMAKSRGTSKHFRLIQNAMTPRLAGPGRLMDDTVSWGGIVRRVSRHLLTCTCLRRTWHEAVDCAIWMDSHVYMSDLFSYHKMVGMHT
jgi:hypothetical protein